MGKYEDSNPVSIGQFALIVVLQGRYADCPILKLG